MRDSLLPSRFEKAFYLIGLKKYPMPSKNLMRERGTRRKDIN